MTKMLFDGGINMGYQFGMVMGWKQQADDFSKLQAEAWEFTKTNLDEGIPVYGWELAIPEFYVVNGYDEVGYYYSGPGADERGGPKPWKELGDTGIGMIEMYSVKPGTPKKDAKVVKSALQNVIKHAGNPKEWIFEKYAAGLKGYDTWISGLENGIAGRFGVGYNAAVWHECRKYAVDFLIEAKERLPDVASKQFDQAISHYQVVVDSLGKVSDIYPFQPGGDDEVISVDDQCRLAIDFLENARAAEAEGLTLLDAIQAAL
jgi:hypothetical protein